MNEIITSAGNAQIKALRALEQKKEREATGLFTLEGARNIQAALEQGWQIDSLVSVAGTQVPKVIAVATARHLQVTAELMSRLAGRDNAQPVWAALQQKWSKLDEVSQGLWVGLEDIRDPGNLGTILRTLAAVGAVGVVLIGECCDAYAPEVIRASVGTFALCRLVRTSKTEFLGWRAQYKGQVIATHLDGSVDYRTPKYQAPLLILMGSEQAGLTPALAACADVKVRIPMQPQVESLNVATATALMLYQAGHSP